MMRAAHRPVSPHPLASARSPGRPSNSAIRSNSQRSLTPSNRSQARNLSQSPMNTPLKSAAVPTSSKPSSSIDDIKVIVIPKVDAEIQTNFTIASSDEAVFVTLGELRQIKKERDSLENLLSDSVSTVELMKEKYDEVKRENRELYALVLELEEKYKAAVEGREDLKDQVLALQTELDVSRKVEVLATVNFQQKSNLPASILDSSRSILRVDTELTNLQSKVVTDLKSLADKAYDCLVEMEAEEVEMQKKFNGVAFERKEEIDPYKGVPRVKNPKVQHEPGFKFGSPSTRYPVVAELINEEQGEEETRLDAEEDGGYEEEDKNGYEENGEDYYDNLDEGYDENIDRHAQYEEGEYEEDQPV
eukprot:gene32853-39725_t